MKASIRAVRLAFTLATLALLAVPIWAQEEEVLTPRGAELPTIDIEGDIDTPPVVIGNPNNGPSSGGPATQLDKAFASLGFGDNATLNGFYSIPPDPIGAAGLTRVIAVTNVMIESRSKDGELQWRSGLGGFFAPVGLIQGSRLFDPKIVYDPHTNRFVVVVLELRSGSTTAQTHPNNASRILLAVSSGANPTSGAASQWHFAAIDAKFQLSGYDLWADYPGLEVDDKAIYVTNNMFTFFGGGSLSAGSRLWIVPKGLDGGLYAGGPTTSAMYNPYATTAGAINTTTMPAEVRQAGGTGPGNGTFLVSYSGLSGGGSEFVQVIRILNPLGTPTFNVSLVFLGDIDTATGALPGARQLGTTATINTNDRRALDAVWQNGDLWAVFTVRTPTGPEAGQVAAHWVRVATASVDFSTWFGALTGLVDQGSIGGEDIAPGTYTFFPAVAVNRDGHAVFGFSASAQTIYAGAYVTSRKAGDPAGTVRSSTTVAAGLDYYVRTFGSGRNRWGDYSGVSLDPSNEDHVWVFNEFADTRGTILSQFPTEDGRWRTVWGRYKLLGK